MTKSYNPIDILSVSVMKYNELMELTKNDKLLETEEYLWQSYQHTEINNGIHEKCRIFLDLLIVRSWMHEKGIEVPKRNFEDIEKEE